MKKDFVFPHSVQVELFDMLTDKQKIETANVFRHLKKASQVELCFALMDYIEDAVIPDFTDEDLILATGFVSLTGYQMPEKAPWAILPGQNKTIKELPAPKQPRRLGDILGEMFPMFNNPKK